MSLFLEALGEGMKPELRLGEIAGEDLSDNQGEGLMSVWQSRGTCLTSISLSSTLIELASPSTP